MLKSFLFIAVSSLWIANFALAEEGTETAPDEAANGAPPEAPEAAQATPPPPPRTPPLRLDRQKADRLAAQLSQNESDQSQIQWFNEGSEEQFLGLYIQEYGEEPQGYALILHDNQQHADWPGVVRELRTHLPAGGWSTLSIGLPDRWDIPDQPERESPDVVIEQPPTTAPPETDTETTDETPPPAENPMAAVSAGLDTTPEPTAPVEQAPHTTSEKGMAFTQLSVEYPPEEIPVVFQRRVMEALDYLKGMDPMPVIIISVGTSATMMAKQAHDLKMRDIAGLVIINPAPILDKSFHIDKDATGLRIPLLDISPQFNPKSDPAPRKRNAKRESRTTYEQNTIPGTTSDFDGHEATLIKKIRGWAKRVVIDKTRFGYL